MSKILEIISKEDIEELMEYIISKDNIVNNSTLNYYKSSKSDSNSEVLESIKCLEKFSYVEKGLSLYKLIETISFIIFKSYLKRKNIDLDNLLRRDERYKWKESLKNNKCIEISKAIDTCTSDDIINSLIYLYTDMIGLIERKSTGTEFTPEEIVRFMFDSIEYKGNKIINSYILEPSCGSGIFLREAINRISNEVKKDNRLNIVDLLLEKRILKAIDINPVNVLISKIVMIITILENDINLTEDEIFKLLVKLPIKIGNTLELDCENGYDYIIGNPPYIRLQNLEESSREYIKNNFKSATGRFDLYVCFMEKCTELLNIDGGLSLITSNKYLTANYGKGIRSYIKNNLNIEMIFDLNDTKYFDAAILPAIIQGKKEKIIDNNKFEYYHIKQDNSPDENQEYINIFEKILSLKGKSEELQQKCTINIKGKKMNIEFVCSVESLSNKKDQWNFGSKEYNDIKKYIENQDVVCLSSIADVCVGIKTTADNVFVKPMSKEFIEKNMLEDEVIFPLLQSKNIERWVIHWNEGEKYSGYVLYPHKVENNKMVAVDLDLYPNAKKYIYENEEILKNRKYLMESNTRKWYECWVPQHLEKFKQHKIVTRDIVSHNCFAIDYSGMICQGNTFFILLNESKIPDWLTADQYLKFILAVLNSEIMEFYHKTISGSLYAKKFRYTTSNLNRWIIPNINKIDKNDVFRIIENVEILLNNHNECINIMEAEINKYIYNMYNINSNQIKQIKEFIEINT